MSGGARRLLIFDPRPRPPRSARPRPARLTTLDGAVIATVDNGKQNAGDFLALVIGELQRAWSIAGVVHVGPPSPGHGGDAEDARVAAGFATAAIAGVGDCGSCSVGTMSDLLLFEQFGIPATAVFTRPFLPAANAIAARAGLDRPGLVVVDHPLAGVDDDGLRDRANVAADAIASALLEDRFSRRG